jgi:hypothetical protein
MFTIDEYLIGDWNGDGVDDLAVRIDFKIFMDYTQDGVADEVQEYGRGNDEDEYLVGDWDGDGRDNIAVRRGFEVLMDTDFAGGEDITLAYGRGNNEDEYLVGDWDGDGRDNIAVRRGFEVLMDTDFGGGDGIIQEYGTGNNEDEYLVGDWDGDGRDNLAVRRNFEVLMDTDFAGGEDITQAYGRGNNEDEYLVGDWDGDGRDNLAVRRDFQVLMDTDFDSDGNFIRTLNPDIGAVEFRSIDGSDNNLANPEWGTPESQLIRLTSPAYDNGTSTPRGGIVSSLPTPRVISNVVFDQTELIPNSAGVSDWFWQWGQFIDHDLDLTPAGSEAFNIPVPAGDEVFDQNNTGNRTIGFNRSIFDFSTGTREQINEITAYIDASNVYGSDEDRAEALRTSDGTGKLNTSIGENGEILLPFNTQNLGNDNPFNRNPQELFLAGDPRANEQVGLTAAHILFVREHNRLAEEIGQRLDDGETELVDLFEESELSRGDFIYEAARRIVGAEIQAITYNEFLPLLLGNNALDDYSGYGGNVNPGISNEFSTAAFRFGHTMLSPTLQNGTTEGITLRDAFFKPNLVETNGIDGLLAGLGAQEAQAIDAMVIDDVRNLLFDPFGVNVSDLASLNIQRGRDHGLASYTEVREELGLDPITNFAQITSDPEVQADLAAAYGTVNKVDLWVGGLAEDPVNGALVGETFQEILANQFTRLRDGDRFYFENDPLLSILAPDIEQTTLSSVILDNSSISSLQNNIFLV